MPIGQNVVDHILSMANNIKSGLKFILAGNSFQPHLQVIDGSHRKHIISLTFGLLEDFESALINHRNTSYFFTIENRIKWEICLGLLSNKIYPDLFVSDEMINEKGDWIDPVRSRKDYNVSFDQKMTKHLSDGFQYLIGNLDALIEMSKPLPLEDIREHQKELHKFRKNYLEHKNFNTDGASVESLQYLKAAAVGKIMELENQKRQSNITRIAQAIDDEIYLIVNNLCEEMFFRIKLPDFMTSIKELSDASPSGKTDISSITVATLSQVDRYDVAFSLAHEQHDYVDNVFNEIKTTEPSLKVFYYRDEEQEIKLWGRNMVTLLQKIYRDQSNHVIIFVSKEYVKKRWVRHEWRSVQEAILDREEEYLLPARFDDSELEGLHSTTHYIDLRKKTPKEFGEMIVTKVRSLTKL